MAKTQQRVIAELMDRLDPLVDTQSEYESSDRKFTEQQLKITKRFVELIGGVELAREIIDKISDCEECLDLVDIDEPSDDGTIATMANLIPNLPDLPMGLSNNLYNPAGGDSRMM